MELISTADVLGTCYKVEKVTDRNEWADDNYDGYCDAYEKTIKYFDHNAMDEWKNNSPEARHEADKQVLRHEFFHAFLCESGLRQETHNDWAENEEMVDWLACMSPKIFKTFKELELI